MNEMIEEYGNMVLSVLAAAGIMFITMAVFRAEGEFQEILNYWGGKIF